MSNCSRGSVWPTRWQSTAMSEAASFRNAEATLEPTRLTIGELHEEIRAGRLASRDVVAAFAGQAKVVGAATDCWVSGAPSVPDVPATSPAGDADLPLAGIPFGHKDVFVDGAPPPRAGSQFDDLCAEPGRAPVLAALLDAGAVALGKLALDELSYGATGLHAPRGPVRNPWNPTLMAGGSSSGAAVAVAGRAVAFAIGADTGGSVRIPAALCGVLGLKPTFGSIDTRGMAPLSPSQDTIGLMAGRAEDGALVLAAIRRPAPGGDAPARMRNAATGNFVAALAEASTAPGASTASHQALATCPLQGVRMAIALHPFFELRDADLSLRTMEALRVFEQLGATLHPLPIDDIESYDAHAKAMTSFEAYEIHRERLLHAPHRLSAATRLRLAAAGRVDPSDYTRAVAARVPNLRRFVARVFGEHDVLVCPSVTVRAQPIAALVGQPQAAVALTTSLLRSNRCFNYLGVPALSLPIGFDDVGMPVGLQLVGRPWAEFELLSYCDAYQRQTAWHLLHPSLVER